MMKRKGFTLVEILFVVVIVGILVAILVPNALKAVAAANTKACAGNIRSIDAAFVACYADTRDWASCDDIAALVTGGYLEDTPVCPIGVDYAADSTNGRRCARTGHFSAGNFPHTHDAVVVE
ncbi:MAG: prepilin-type N-terminal cleavage/methylation domain-containing protein [Candidatus Aceula meridiana]|nr:prepilin-type N-terminal cleavage/methylation domain-containing protein [Candidatus Aceula meridiana]